MQSYSSVLTQRSVTDAHDLAAGGAALVASGGGPRRLWEDNGLTGQSLLVLMASRMMDVLWGDLHMKPQGRIFEEWRFFLSTFPHRLNSKRSYPEAEILPHETKIRLKKSNTSQKNLL